MMGGDLGAQRICRHEIWEATSACADGMCPLCQSAEIERLTRELADARTELARIRGLPRLAALDDEVASLTRERDALATRPHPADFASDDEYFDAFARWDQKQGGLVSDGKGGLRRA